MGGGGTGRGGWGSVVDRDRFGDVCQRLFHRVHIPALHDLLDSGDGPERKRVQVLIAIRVPARFGPEHAFQQSPGRAGAAADKGAHNGNPAVLSSVGQVLVQLSLGEGHEREQELDDILEAVLFGQRHVVLVFGFCAAREETFEK